jgi:hypothetical protein
MQPVVLSPSAGVFVVWPLRKNTRRGTETLYIDGREECITLEIKINYE